MATELAFFKYQGTGNDFILVDQRKQGHISKTDTELVRHLCDRRFGVGADGLILLEEPVPNAYTMVYFNSDGSESTMCGNGGRCFAAFALHLGIISDKLTFTAIDGKHEAIVKKVNAQTCHVELQMIDVKQVNQIESDSFVLQTGSPHFVKFTENQLAEIDIISEGRAIRNSDPYKTQNGINVNFVNKTKDQLIMRTYERGVEDETLSCGTGVTAAALAAHYTSARPTGKHSQRVSVLGGVLEVKFEYSANLGYHDIWLCGPAVQVFSGKVFL
jgi:diaminopimelate epimerase